jgi:acyl dehydratase
VAALTVPEVGKTIRHWPGRTISEFDDTFFSLMSMNQHPVHIDAHYAAGRQHGQRLVVGPLVIAIVVGLSAELGWPSLEYEDVRHISPVFHGDTIYAESTVAFVDDDAITIDSRGLNQRGEVVLTMRRRASRRPA